MGRESPPIPTTRGAINLPTSSFSTQTIWPDRAVGAYGNQEIKTPQLDRLARRGVDLSQCLHGHAGLLALAGGTHLPSRYPSELGIADWIDPRKEPELGLAQAAIIWPELLQRLWLPNHAGGQVACRNARPVPPDSAGL